MPKQKLEAWGGPWEGHQVESPLKVKRSPLKVERSPLKAKRVPLKGKWSPLYSR